MNYNKYFLDKLSIRLEDGTPDFSRSEDRNELAKMLNEYGIPQEDINDVILMLEGGAIRKNGEVYKMKNGTIGAKNQDGVIQYFDPKEDKNAKKNAELYAKGGKKTQPKEEPKNTKSKPKEEPKNLKQKDQSKSSTTHNTELTNKIIGTIDGTPVREVKQFAPKVSRDIPNKKNTLTEKAFTDTKLDGDGINVGKSLGTDISISKHTKNINTIPKKYIKLIDKFLNTASEGSNITGFINTSGLGTINSTAGEIMAMAFTSMDDASAEQLYKHLMSQNIHKDAILNKSWIEAAYNNRKGINYSIQRKYPNAKIKAIAWDIKDEVEALGFPYDKKQKSTDVFIKIEDENGKEKLVEISLKKDEEANMLNSSVMKAITNYISSEMKNTKRTISKEESQELNIPINTTDEEYITALENQYSSIKGKSAIAIAEKEKIKSKIDKLTTEYYDNLPKSLNYPKFLDNQANMLVEAGNKYETKILNNINKIEDPKLKKLLIEYKNQKQKNKNLELGSWLKSQPGNIRRTNKNILQSLTYTMGNDISELKQLKQLSDDVSISYFNILKDDPKMATHLIDALSDELPIVGILQGNEHLIVGDLPIDEFSLKAALGINSVDDFMAGITINPKDIPPYFKFYSKSQDKYIELAKIGVRQDGVMYGNTHKLEAKIGKPLCTGIRKIVYPETMKTNNKKTK